MNDYSMEQYQKELLAQAKNFLVDYWEKMIGFFNSYHWKEVLFGIKTVFIAISLIFLFLIIILLIKMNIGKKPGVILNKKKIEKKWLKIGKRLNSGVEENFKLAVLEADKIFDDILKNVGYEKEKTIGNVEDIKQVRKIKNKIVDDSGFKLSRDETEKIIEDYKKGLEDLGVL